MIKFFDRTFYAVENKAFGSLMSFVSAEMTERGPSWPSSDRLGYKFKRSTNPDCRGYQPDDLEMPQLGACCGAAGWVLLFDSTGCSKCLKLFIMQRMDRRL